MKTPIYCDSSIHTNKSSKKKFVSVSETQVSETSDLIILKSLNVPQIVSLLYLEDIYSKIVSHYQKCISCALSSDEASDEYFLLFSKVLWFLEPEMKEKMSLTMPLSNHSNSNAPW